MDINKIIATNEQRKKVFTETFNPISGQGAPLNRFEFNLSDLSTVYLPIALKSNKLIVNLRKAGSIEKFSNKNKCTSKYILETLLKIRIKEDFTYWAASFVFIKSKDGGNNIPFVINFPQRKTLIELEKMRLSNTPIRMIILKARQWGGSTLVQIYMAWIQLVHREGYYSAIVAHLNSASFKIRAMFAKFIREYPPELLGLDNKPLELKPYEGSHTDVIIAQGGKAVRDTVICVGTMESPENVRGGDIALAHFSEVGLWKETKGKSPEDILRSVSSSILYRPYTMDVMESTANGEDTLFHREWCAAVAKQSMRIPVFVAWYEIENYSIEFKNETDKVNFAKNIYEKKDNNTTNSNREESGTYIWWLWQLGATLEAINWYIVERKKFSDHASMASEFPSNDIEAFKHSGSKVFDQYHVEKLRASCKQPITIGEVRGDAPFDAKALKNIRFCEDMQGLLKIWEMPDTSFRASNRYVVAVDVGGRSSKADFSIITVIDRWWRTAGEGDVIVAQWKGHIRHDLLAWKMAQVATFYNNALLIPEANTFETKDNDTEGEHTDYILNRIAESYSNMYIREAPQDAISNTQATRWGFHTNRSTKSLIIDNLITLVEEQAYTERDEDALIEYNAYVRNPKNGSMGASEGHHDDMLMSRAIGLYISSTLPMPKEIIVNNNRNNISKTINEATL